MDGLFLLKAFGVVVVAKAEVRGMGVLRWALLAGSLPPRLLFARRSAIERHTRCSFVYRERGGAGTKDEAKYFRV